MTWNDITMELDNKYNLYRLASARFDAQALACVTPEGPESEAFRAAYRELIIAGLEMHEAFDAYNALLRDAS